MLVRFSLFSSSPGPYKRGVVGFPILSPAAFGIVKDSKDWRLALKLYAQDRVDAAYARAEQAGIGEGAEYAEAFQLVAAEYETRLRSQVTRVNEWLELETIPSELSVSVSEIGEIAQSAVSGIFRGIGLRLGIPIRIAVLDPAVFLPVYLAGSGYVTLKEPYAKYCIPAIAATESQKLKVQFEALAASHAAGFLSSEAAAPWLVAAVQALGSMPVEPQLRLQFCAGQRKWLTPNELDLRLIGNNLGDDEEDAIQAARIQAILIGRYLLAAEDVSVLRDCLTYHTPKNGAEQLRLLMSNDITRDACKQTYGYAPEYLFEQALAACCR